MSCGELVLFLGFTTFEAVNFFWIGDKEPLLPYKQFDVLSRITLKSLRPNLGCLQLSHARTQAASVYNSLGGLFFFPAVFDNCSIHDPERNHQWELMSAPLRLALLRGGAGTGAARSCNACTRVPAAGSRLGVGRGEGEQAGAMRTGTSGRAAPAQPPQRVPGPAAPAAARAVRPGPGGHGQAPLLPSAALSPLPAGRLTVGFAAVLLFVKGREGVKVAP